MRHFTLFNKRAVNYFLDCSFVCRPIWGNDAVSATPAIGGICIMLYHVLIVGGGTAFPHVPPPLHHCLCNALLYTSLIFV